MEVVLLGLLIAMGIGVLVLWLQVRSWKRKALGEEHVHEWGPYGIPYNVHHPKAYDEIDFEYRPPWDETRQMRTCTTCGITESTRVR